MINHYSFNHSYSVHLFPSSHIPSSQPRTHIHPMHLPLMQSLSKSIKQQHTRIPNHNARIPDKNSFPTRSLDLIKCVHPGNKQTVAIPLIHVEPKTKAHSHHFRVNKENMMVIRTV
jgi:hypothetical protein